MKTRENYSITNSEGIPLPLPEEAVVVEHAGERSIEWQVEATQELE